MQSDARPTLTQQKHFNPSMKEMVGGCCVCSDERGWAENPLVYCDGQGCTVAVHQACYGIVTVPTGPWFCRKCESQERAARVRCELCPCRDGALKRTDNSAWAHVVCALYIPEVRFGNVTTMEPIILQLIPSERYNKTCYICEEQGKANRSSVGACMQCNKAGCKQQFHVTCAQALGLLCEEAGNYLDNVKYCGYCQHHYSKLVKLMKKGGHVKTIPPYKPISADSADSSPEKEGAAVVVKPATAGKRKYAAKGSAIAPKAQKITEITGPDTSEAKDNSNPSVTGATKFTTSNFVESVVTPSESVFGTDPNPGRVKPPTPQPGRRRKTGSRAPTPTVDPPKVSTPTSHPGQATITLATTIKTETSPTNSQSVDLDTPTIKMEVLEKKPKLEHLPQPMNESVVIQNIQSKSVSIPSGSVAKSNVITNTNSLPGIMVSVPLTAASLQSPNSSALTSPTIFQQLQQSIAANNASNERSQQTSQPLTINPVPTETKQSEQPDKKIKSECVEKVDKGKKNKRTPLPPTTTPSLVAPASPASKPPSQSTDVSTPPPVPPPPPRSTVQTQSSNPTPPPAARPTAIPAQVKESPPSSPASETPLQQQQSNTGRRKKKQQQQQLLPREEKDKQVFQNGVGAAHMLGNQLNPSSNMSKKLSDTLSAELEAHSIFTDSSNNTTSLVGPQLHSRVIASIRSGANQSNNSMSVGSAFNQAANQANSSLIQSTGHGSGGSGGGSQVNSSINSSGTSSSSLAASIPQSLDQLLERQWEQGSQFLMEQAQHFDIASLLSCLHQLRAENVRLEEHVNSLLQRRDHLLAVNARLAIPLSTQPPSSQGINSMHSEPANRPPRTSNPYPVENGLDNQVSHGVYPQTSPSIRHSPSVPDVSRRSQGNYQQSYQAVSSPSVPPHQNSPLSAATTQAIHSARRDAVTDLHSMPSSKPS